MTNFATDALWDNATRDLDAEAHRSIVVSAKVALSGSWPFLAAAQNEEEFEARLALMQDQIVAQTPPQVLHEVVAGLRQDFEELVTDRTRDFMERHTAALQVTAATHPAGEMPDAFVHVHKHGSGDDEYFQVDHVASPTWSQTLTRAGSRDEAMQHAREFGLPSGLPIFENGLYVEGAKLPDVDPVSEQFFHTGRNQWVAVKGGMTYHEMYGEVSKPQLAAYRKHNIPPAMHNDLEEYFGQGNHDAITSYVKNHAARGPHGMNYGDVFRDAPDKSTGALREGADSRDARGGGGWGRIGMQSEAQANAWRGRDGSIPGGSTGWTADLTTPERWHPGFGWVADNAWTTNSAANPHYLGAQQVTATNYQPDPDMAWRYHYGPNPTAPAQQPVGGYVTGPVPGEAQIGHDIGSGNTSVDGDGFPRDVAAGEGRSADAYARQLTPGPWVVNPGSEWPQRPNAGRPGTPPVNARRLSQSMVATAAKLGFAPQPYETQAMFAARVGNTILRQVQAGEGVVPTPGPNPNYFSTGTQGLQGENFAQDPSGGIEPKTDNHMDDVYGDVPPQMSSGSSQNQTDGQGYSRMAAAKHKCTNCGGTGTLSAGKKNERDCPTCGGTGSTSKHAACKMENHPLAEGSFLGKVASAGTPFGCPECGHPVQRMGILLNHVITSTGASRLGFSRAAVRKEAVYLPGVLHGMESGQKMQVGDHHTVEYQAQQAMGDDNRPARGYTTGYYHVEGPGGMRSFRHSPYNPVGWASSAKRYAAEQAAKHIGDEEWATKMGRYGSRTAGWQNMGDHDVWSDDEEEPRIPDPKFKPGDRVQTFRGESGTVHSVYPSNTYGKSHKVSFVPDGESEASHPYYEHVFDHHPDTYAGIGHMVDQAMPHEHDIQRAYGRRLASGAYHDPIPHTTDIVGSGLYPYANRYTTRTQQMRNEYGDDVGDGYADAQLHASKGYDARHEPNFHEMNHPDYQYGYDVAHDHMEDEHNQNKARLEPLFHSMRDLASPGAMDLLRSNPTGPTKYSSTNGRIVGNCDHCHRPVRWHENESDADELRHLHNGSNMCNGGEHAKKTGQFIDPRFASDSPAVPSATDATGGMPPASPSDPQPSASPGDEPMAATAMRAWHDTALRALAEVTLQAPTPENPTGRGGDDYSARTYDSLVKQRPMQSAEDRNANTPTLARDPLRTRNINTPTPGLGDDEGGTRENDDDDEEAD